MRHVSKPIHFRVSFKSLFRSAPCTHPSPSNPPVYPLVKMWLEPLWHTTFLPHRHTTFLPVQPGRVPITVSPPQIPPPPPSGFVGVLTSVPVALVIKRAGYTHTGEKAQLNTHHIIKRRWPLPACGKPMRIKPHLYIHVTRGSRSLTLTNPFSVLRCPCCY